jgi:hypothetical protein
VYEYSKKFNHLSQYGSYHADTDEKKMSLFRQGLSLVLCEHLTLFRGCTLNKLLSASIEQEDVCHARLEEERKKRPLPGLIGGTPPKYHLVYIPPSGQPHAQTAGLTLYATQVPYSISTPGGRVVANQMTHKIAHELAGQVFSTALIILEGQGINVILGMN